MHRGDGVEGSGEERKRPQVTPHHRAEVPLGRVEVEGDAVDAVRDQELADRPRRRSQLGEPAGAVAEEASGQLRLEWLADQVPLDQAGPRVPHPLVGQLVRGGLGGHGGDATERPRRRSWNDCPVERMLAGVPAALGVDGSGTSPSERRASLPSATPDPVIVRHRSGTTLTDLSFDVG